MLFWRPNHWPFLCMGLNRNLSTSTSRACVIHKLQKTVFSRHLDCWFVNINKDNTLLVKYLTFYLLEIWYFPNFPLSFLYSLGQHFRSHWAFHENSAFLNDKELQFEKIRLCGKKLNFL